MCVWTGWWMATVLLACGARVVDGDLSGAKKDKAVQMDVAQAEGAAAYAGRRGEATTFMRGLQASSVLRGASLSPTAAPRNAMNATVAPSPSKDTSTTGSPSAKPSINDVTNPSLAPSAMAAADSVSPSNYVKTPSNTTAAAPSAQPTLITLLPSAQPTSSSTRSPSAVQASPISTAPIASPSQVPTTSSSGQPTLSTTAPTTSLTPSPTTSPAFPTVVPTVSTEPSLKTTSTVTLSPSANSTTLTHSPSVPTSTTAPSSAPSASVSATSAPTHAPSAISTASPTSTSTTTLPSVSPSAQPTLVAPSPSLQPTSTPTESSSSTTPTSSQTATPTTRTGSPSQVPTGSSSVLPTSITSAPTNSLSAIPTTSTSAPSQFPTVAPSVLPTSITSAPTNSLSVTPTTSTSTPSQFPTVAPSIQPTPITSLPTSSQTETPITSTSSPSQIPTTTPSGQPTSSPTALPNSPTATPTTITESPIQVPSAIPSSQPTPVPGSPTFQPTYTTTTSPTTSKPTFLPSTTRPVSPVAVSSSNTSFAGASTHTLSTPEVGGVAASVLVLLSIIACCLWRRHNYKVKMTKKGATDAPDQDAIEGAETKVDASILMYAPAPSHTSAQAGRLGNIQAESRSPSSRSAAELSSSTSQTIAMPSVTRTYTKSAVPYLLDPKFDHDLTHITEFAIDESRKAYRIVQADGSTSDICLVVDYDNIIGAGSQGIVYRGTFGKDTPAAVKVINIFHPDSVSFHTVDQLLKELRLLKAVAPHPTIVKYFMCAVCSRPDRAFLVLEYCEHGDLWRYMETLREAGVPFTVSRKLELILDVTTAVAWLHCLPKPVLHGDLKASNVLVGNDGKAKVADFGISVLLEGSFSVSAAKTNRMTGTPAYLAPEMWEDTYRRSRAQDVYALGVLLWEVMHETKPWEGEPLLRVMQQVASGKRPKIRPDLDEGLVHVIESCWHQDPKKRPLAKEVLALISSLSLISSRVQEISAIAVETVSSTIIKQVLQQARASDEQSQQAIIESVQQVCIASEADPFVHEGQSLLVYEADLAQSVADLHALLTSVLVPEMQRLSRNVGEVSSNVLQVLKYSKQQRSMIHSLVAGVTDFPLTPIFISSSDMSLFRKLDPRKLFIKEVQLCFICPVSGRLGNEYTVQISRKWLMRTALLLKASAMILNVAAMAMSQVNIPIHIATAELDRLNQARTTTEFLLRVIDNTKEVEEAVIEDAVEGDNYVGESKDASPHSRSPSTMQPLTELLQVSEDSKYAVREVLFIADTIPPKNTGMVQVISDADGTVCWIHPDARAIFHRDGCACFRAFDGKDFQPSPKTA